MAAGIVGIGIEEDAWKVSEIDVMTSLNLDTHKHPQSHKMVKKSGGTKRVEEQLGIKATLRGWWPGEEGREGTSAGTQGRRGEGTRPSMKEQKRRLITLFHPRRPC